MATLAAGGRQSMGLTAAGELVCWGLYEDLCPEMTLSVIEPGYFHACGLTDGSEPVCWGDETEAEPGLFEPPAGPFVSLTSGWFHTCGLTAAGEVDCWGDDANGKLDPPEGVTFTQLSAGRDFTCGLTTEAAMACWGEPGNDQGQAEDLAGPFQQVSSGFYHSCGLGLDGTITCQGRVFDEASGPVTEPADPTQPPAGSFVLLPDKMGYAHGCALDETLVVQCWGADYNGQVSGVPTVSFAASSTP